MSGKQLLTGRASVRIHPLVDQSPLEDPTTVDHLRVARSTDPHPADEMPTFPDDPHASDILALHQMMLRTLTDLSDIMGAVKLIEVYSHLCVNTRIISLLCVYSVTLYAGCSPVGVYLDTCY